MSDPFDPPHRERRDPRHTSVAPPPSVADPGLKGPDQAPRGNTLWLYLGPIAVLAVVLGVMVFYFASRGPSLDQGVNSAPIGTTGDQRREGGGDPASTPSNTREELDTRGVR